MSETKLPTETEQPFPLRREEILALVGAGMVVLGALLPAFNPGSGSPQSLAESGNTVAVVLWGMAAAVAWKIVGRKAHEAAVVGVVCFLFLAVYGFFVWREELREPVKTFFGTLQASFRPTAWMVSAVGTAVIVFSARRESRSLSATRNGSDRSQQLRAIGVAFAVLGCLVALAIVNPFSPLAPAEFRRNWRAWSHEIAALRWIGLGAASMAILAGFEYPSRAPVMLKPVIQTFGILIGACLIFIVGVIDPSAQTLTFIITAVWGLASAAIFVTRRSQQLMRWQQLVVWSPFVTMFVLLVVSGEVHDAMLIMVPAFMIGAGYVMCRHTTCVDIAIFSSAIVIGLPAGLMALSGVPNEITDLWGMSPAESRAILLGVCVLLVWAVYLSFQNEGVTSTAVLPPAENAVIDPGRGTDT